MKRTAAILALLFTALGTPGGVEACGYHDPSLVARGMLNWTYPKALYVGTAVWQAQNAGILAKRERKKPKDLFAYQRTMADLQELGRKIGTANPSAKPNFSLVLIDAMLWTRFKASPEGYLPDIHVDGPARGDAVVVTHGKVIEAINEGVLDARRAEKLGLFRLYGPLPAQGAVRNVLAGTSTAKGNAPTKLTDKVD